MKKTAFYTLCDRGDGVKAYRVDGYSDGVYFYYNSRNYGGETWCAIIPETGVCCCIAQTRRDVVAKANSPAVCKCVASFLTCCGEERREIFRQCVDARRLANLHGEGVTC